MASHRVGETGLTDSGPSSQHHHHHMTYSVLHGINNPSDNFINQGGSAFDFGELEEAIVLQGVKIRNDEAKPPLFTVSGRPAATLEMFPSWPMRFQQQTPRVGSSKTGGGEESTVSGSEMNTLSSKADPDSPISKKASTSDQTQMHLQHQQVLAQMVSDASRADGSSQLHQNQSPAKFGQDKKKRDELWNWQNQFSSMSESDSVDLICPHHVPEYLLQYQNSPQQHTTELPPRNYSRKGLTSEKPLDAKTLRRLAQNREAAKKSRLRKKAYVQQLESSRIKLSQLEQELQRARQQGLYLGGCGGNMSPGAAMFDMEYARWLEDDHRHMSELRTGLHAHLTEGDLKVIIDRYITHYDEIFRLKAVAAKSDVFHLITGMWSTPAERCFLWMGGFRPSELIKMLVPQLDPLTEQQLMGIYSLQHSTQQTEEALTQGLDQLRQSLVDTISGDQVVDGMQQMAVALGKLANLEGFVRQADNLRQQTLHQLRRILTVRQAARCFLVIGEYYGRLRALSSLWASRPRDGSMGEDNSCQTAATELQMMQSLQNHFPNF